MTETQSTPSRAIVYARFSPRRNEDETESIETQVEACEDLCRKQGYAVEAVFSDRAASGKDEDRPGLWDAVRSLKKGYVLVVYKSDRLARNLYLSEWLRREIRAKGAKLEVVSGMSEGDSPEATLIRQVLDAFSEYERKLTSARTSFAMLRHQRTGRRMSRHPPYGWDFDPSDPQRWIRNEEEGKAVEKILDWRRKGAAWRRIATLLGEEGHKSRGSEWQGKTVKKIFNRETT
ncbi:MAG TPA: recombinase family protein [Polyangiales bacterium]|nr:recombinase family protein [Polyangiales bacterium]